MFDVKEDADVDSNTISKLMEQLDVFISVKPKPKQPSKVKLYKYSETYSTTKWLLYPSCILCRVTLNPSLVGGRWKRVSGCTSSFNFMSQGTFLATGRLKE